MRGRKRGVLLVSYQISTRMDFVNFRKPTTIVAITLGVISIVTLGSAIRFDYRRRHDAIFRSKLSKSLAALSERVGIDEGCGGR